MVRRTLDPEAQKAADAALERADEVASAAVKTLEEIAVDPVQPSSVRVDAALGLLSHYRHFYG